MKILITGANSGIGLACTKHYKMHKITPIDKKELDLSDLSAVSAYADNMNTFDALIYCAGIREIEAPHTLSMETWLNVLNINLTANFLLSSGLIKKSLAHKKPLAIINIASVSGFQAEPDRAAYVSSKHALIGLTKQLAFQYGCDGIRTNAIAPGIIETPLTKHYFDDPAQANKIKASIPVRHWGQVSHILPLVDLCLTNHYINGSVLVCDGGWTTGRTI